MDWCCINNNNTAASMAFSAYLSHRYIRSTTDMRCNILDLQNYSHEMDKNEAKEILQKLEHYFPLKYCQNIYFEWGTVQYANIFTTNQLHSSATDQ